VIFNTGDFYFYVKTFSFGDVADVLAAQIDSKTKEKEKELMENSEEIGIFWTLDMSGIASGTHALTVPAQSVSTTIEFFVSGFAAVCQASLPHICAA
jgi:hypothetical protein